MSRMPRVAVRTAEEGHQVRLSHDLPCRHCGHAPHRFLPCDHRCGCPGEDA